MTGGRTAGPLKTILVVEDEQAVREGIAELLHEEGYSVFSAANGRKALELLEIIPRPCLMLVDLMMPQMSGRALLAAMRHDDRFTSIPCVVVSGAAEPAARARLRAPFMKKPFNVELLLRMIEEVSK